MIGKKLLLIVAAVTLILGSGGAFAASASATSSGYDHYVIQLMSCVNVGNVTNFIKNNNLSGKAYYYKSNINGKAWYTLVYGNYSTEAQARSALHNLPANIKNLRPVVRPVASSSAGAAGRSDGYDHSYKGGASGGGKSEGVSKSVVHDDGLAFSQVPGKDNQVSLAQLAMIQRAQTQPIKQTPIVVAPDGSSAAYKPQQRSTTLAANTHNSFKITRQKDAEIDASTRTVIKPQNEHYSAEYAKLMASENPYFDLRPKVTVGAYLGTNDFNNITASDIVGRAQLLLPFRFGDPTYAFLGGIDAAYSANSENGGMGGVGIGIRKIVMDTVILGGYVFGTVNKSPFKNTFEVINPGIEALWQNWDLRLNGYVSLGEKNQFDAIKKATEHVGNGFDVEGGAALPFIDGLKFYAGGYFFNFDRASNVKGIAGRLAYTIADLVTIEVRDTYDNYKRNTVIAGLTLDFGGVKNKADDDIGVARRMVDPISKNLATMDKGYAVPVGITHP